MEYSGKCSQRMTSIHLSPVGEHLPFHIMIGAICNEAKDFTSATKCYSFCIQPSECQKCEFSGQNRFPFCRFHYVYSLVVLQMLGQSK